MALVDVIIGYAKGAQGNVGPQGPTGPQGPAGPQGPLPPLVNNALSTTAGVAALDAAMGKTLQDHIDTTNSNLAKFNTISGIVLISTTNITSDEFGQIIVTNTLGTVYAGLISCTKHINGSNYVLTAESISTATILIRARKVTDGSILPAGNSVGSLVFAKWG